MSRYTLSKPEVEKYLKTNISNYDKSRILVTNKSQGDIFIIVDDKFKVLRVNYDNNGLDTLINKLGEYFDGLKWDDNLYVLPYGSNFPNPDGKVIKVPMEKHVSYHNSIRTKFGDDIDFKRVNKPLEPNIIIELEDLLK